ncbi:MAG: magnesium transporter, partial [Rhodoplanes sp.]
MGVPLRPAALEPGLVNSVVYRGGRKLVEIAIDDAGEWARRPGHVVWIGLYEPKRDLLVRVQKQFNLHPLAIEDAE